MKPITASQARAARGLLGWGQADLADEAGVNIQTVRRFENEEVRPMRANLAAMTSALEHAGIQFIAAGKNGGPGVRLRK